MARHEDATRPATTNDNQWPRSAQAVAVEHIGRDVADHLSEGAAPLRHSCGTRWIGEPVEGHTVRQLSHRSFKGRGHCEIASCGDVHIKSRSAEPQREQAHDALHPALSGTIEDEKDGGWR